MDKPTAPPTDTSQAHAEQSNVTQQPTDDRIEQDTAIQRPPAEPPKPGSSKKHRPTGRHKGAELIHRLNRIKALQNARRTDGPRLARLEEAAIAHALIEASRLKEEQALAQHRFLPYRYQSPFQATELFAKEFYESWSRHLLKYWGIANPRPFFPLAMQEDRMVSALWRARQVADALGVPYRLFIDSGMEYMIQESGDQRIPLPNQLFNSKQIRRVLKIWDDRWERDFAFREVLTDGLEPRFLAENYIGDPVQETALDAYAQFIADTEYPEHFLSVLLGKYLSEEQARERFESDLVDEAVRRKERRGDVEPKGDRVIRPYFPSCYGFAFDERSSVCTDCPVQRMCRNTVTEAKVKVAARCGSADPRLEKRREGDRLRQQEYRRRKKLEPKEPK